MSATAGHLACPTGAVAIVVDGQIVSAPTVQAPEFERDHIVIAGSHSADELAEIADALDP